MQVWAGNGNENSSVHEAVAVKEKPKNHAKPHYEESLLCLNVSSPENCEFFEHVDV